MSGEQWRIDLSDEHVYRIDAVKDGRKEVVCEFRRDNAGADARRITDAFERVEAQDEEIERLRGALSGLHEAAPSDDDYRTLLVAFGGTRVSQELHERCDRIGKAHAEAREALNPEVSE